MSDRFLIGFFATSAVVILGLFIISIRETALDKGFCRSAGMIYRPVWHDRAMCMDANGVVYDIDVLKAKLRAKS